MSVKIGFANFGKTVGSKQKLQLDQQEKTKEKQ